MHWERCPFPYLNHFSSSVSIQIRVIDTFPLGICNRLDVPMRDDTTVTLGLLRQPDRHGQPVARLDSPRISRGWIQLDEPKICRRTRSLTHSQSHLLLHHFDSLAIQDAIRPTASDKYRQALSPSLATRVSPCVGAGSIDDPDDAADDLPYELLVDLHDLVQRLAISLPEVIR